MPTSGDDDEVHYFFIRRPVLAIVISVIITLLGVFAIRLLPISRYPQITPPAVQVQAKFPGATAEDVAEAVAAPIEAQLSGSAGAALLLVGERERRDDEPADLLRRDPEPGSGRGRRAERGEARRAAAAGRGAPERHHDPQGQHGHPRRRRAHVERPALRRGVSHELHEAVRRGRDQATPGRRQRADLRRPRVLDADPARSGSDGAARHHGERRRRRGARAERDQPRRAAGREPAPPGTELTLPVTTLGRLKTPDQFDDIVVRAKADGSIVRVRDIGKVVLGSRNYDLAGRLNGRPVAPMLLYLRPGANALAAKEAVVKRMDELARSFPPGVQYAIPFDTTPFVTASIKEVVITLVEAMVLVTLVVFIFLQSWRATLIPMLAVPVSVIGTFLGLLVFGFSINVLTLFALVLAIGIVVDDAIVVIENVERIMANEGLSAAGRGRPRHSAGAPAR